MLSCLHSVFLSFDSDVVMLTMVQVHVIYVSFILVCLTSNNASRPTSYQDSSWVNGIDAICGSYLAGHFPLSYLLIIIIIVPHSIESWDHLHVSKYCNVGRHHCCIKLKIKILVILCYSMCCIRLCSLRYCITLRYNGAGSLQFVSEEFNKQASFLRVPISASALSTALQPLLPWFQALKHCMLLCKSTYFCVHMCVCTYVFVGLCPSLSMYSCACKCCPFCVHKSVPPFQACIFESLGICLSTFQCS